MQIRLRPPAGAGVAGAMSPGSTLGPALASEAALAVADGRGGSGIGGRGALSPQ